MRTQEISSNYNPNFGMALMKPVGKSLQKFEKEVLGDDCAKLAKKGFNRLIKQQANNANFDVYYLSSLEKTRVKSNDSGFVIYNRNTGKIEDVFSLNGTVYPNSFTRKMDKYASEVEAERSPTGRSYLSTKAIFGLMKDLITVKLFKQEELLPDALRAACDKANRLEADLLKAKDSI